MRHVDRYHIYADDYGNLIKKEDEEGAFADYWDVELLQEAITEARKAFDKYKELANTAEHFMDGQAWDDMERLEKEIEGWLE